MEKIELYDLLERKKAGEDIPFKRLFKSFQEISDQHPKLEEATNFLYPLFLINQLAEADQIDTEFGKLPLGSNGQRRINRIWKDLETSITAGALNLEPNIVPAKKTKDHFVKISTRERTKQRRINQKQLLLFTSKLDADRVQLQVKRYLDLLGKLKETPKGQIQEIISSFGPEYIVISNSGWITALLSLRLSIFDTFFGVLIDPYKALNKEGVKEHVRVLNLIGNTYEKALQPLFQVDLESGISFYHWKSVIGKRTSDEYSRRVLRIVHRKLTAIGEVSRFGYVQIDEGKPFPPAGETEFQRLFKRGSDYQHLIRWLISQKIVLDDRNWRKSSLKSEMLALRDPLIELNILRKNNKTHVGRVICEHFGHSADPKTYRNPSERNRKDLEDFIRENLTFN